MSTCISYVCGYMLMYIHVSYTLIDKRMIIIMMYMYMYVYVGVFFCFLNVAGAKITMTMSTFCN